MATNFPTSLDTLTNPTSTDTLNSPSHASQHANANDAIEALQAKVGANSSAVQTSHDYKLSGVTGSDKAVSLTGSEVLTNKTINSANNTLQNIATTNLASPTGLDTNIVTGTAGTSGDLIKWNADGDAVSADTVTIEQGGTGQTTQTAAFDALSPTTTKGDIIVDDGTNAIRVAVGADNTILTADSGETSGVRWATAASENSATINAGETISGATTPAPVYIDKADNEAYLCDANDATKYKFVGFATSNGTDGNPITLQTSGIVNGFTSLDEGEKYYIQDTAGTIGTTAGTQEILVGIAISSTQLLIQKGTLYSSGTATTGTATGSSAVTLGFRPRKIRVCAKNAASQGYSQLDFVWTSAATSSVSARMDGSNATIDNTLRLYQHNNASIYMTFSITSVTDTGFTLSWSESGTFSISSPIMWEAEGSY